MEPSELEVKRNITELANLRTIMAFQRTSCALTAIALLSLKLFPGKEGVEGGVLAVVLCVTAAVIWGYGMWSWQKNNNYLLVGSDRATATEGAPKDEGEDSDFEVLDTIVNQDDVEDYSNNDQELQHHEMNGGRSTHDLAVTRTLLANARTALAYARTSIPHAILGLTATALLQGALAWILGVVFGIGYVFCLCYGAYCWRRDNVFIVAGPSSLPLAMMRTTLANTRTLLSFVRTGLGFGVLIGAALSTFSSFYELAATIVFGLCALACIGYGAYCYLRDDVLINRTECLHELAKWRTVLANIRTLLSYIRTMHPLMALAIVAPTLIDGSAGYAVGMISLAVSIGVVLYGARRWHDNQVCIKAHPSVHELAIQRTEMANVRSFLAFIRVALSLVLIAGVAPQLFPSLSVPFAVFLGVLGLVVGVYGCYRWMMDAKAATWWYIKFVPSA